MVIFAMLGLSSQKEVLTQQRLKPWAGDIAMHSKISQKEVLTQQRLKPQISLLIAGQQMSERSSNTTKIETKKLQ